MDIELPTLRGGLKLTDSVRRATESYQSGNLSKREFAAYLQDRICSVTTLQASFQTMTVPESLFELVEELQECFVDYKMALESLWEVEHGEGIEKEFLDEVVLELSRADGRVQEVMLEFGELEERLQRANPLDQVS